MGVFWGAGTVRAGTRNGTQAQAAWQKKLDTLLKSMQGDESTLALKVRMLLEEPKARFLIYERGALPDPAHDMLLDIRKWAAPFAADKSTLILRELGLIDELSLKSHIADRARFFASRERMDKLVRFIAPGDGAYQIDLKIMAVLARAPQPQLSQILRILLAELDPQNLTADSKTLAEFQRFGVEQAFWDFVAQEFRYADEGPCLRNLLLRLFATDFARHVTGKVPVSLTHLVLPNGGGSNAIVFMDGWRDSSSHQRSYDALSAIIAEDLRIKSQLSGFALADLVMGFPYRDYLFNGAMEAVRAAREVGQVAVLSEGDAAFQPHKIWRIGLDPEVDGNILVFDRKLEHLDELTAVFPADHYVLVEDKPDILAAVKRKLGPRITTVLVRQGKYAAMPLNDDPPPDVTLPSIAALTRDELERIIVDASGPPASGGEPASLLAASRHQDPPS